MKQHILVVSASQFAVLCHGSPGIPLHCGSGTTVSIHCPPEVCFTITGL